MEKQTKTLYIFGVDGDYAEGAGTVAVLMGEGSQCTEVSGRYEFHVSQIPVSICAPSGHLAGCH